MVFLLQPEVIHTNNVDAIYNAICKTILKIVKDKM